MYVGEPDVDVVLGPEPSTHPDHVEYLRPVARLDPDLEEVVRSQPVYGLAVVGRPPAELEPAVAALAAAGIAHDFAPEPLLPGWGVNAMPPGVSKWSGIEAFCAAAGVSPGRCSPWATARTTSRCWSAPHGPSSSPARAPPPAPRRRRHRAARARRLGRLAARLLR